jgi:hypothetical protein
MKLSSLITTIAVALSTLAGTQAKADITQVISINVTTFEQNTNGTSNGTVTNVPPPKVSTHKTGDFLSKLARDENAAGHWTNDVFPAGAKLAVVPSQNDSADFAVIQGTNILVDVSDIISFQSGDLQLGDIEVISGKEDLQTQLASPMTKKIHLGTIIFDDSAVADPSEALTFEMRGVFTETTTDGPVKNGFYTETRTAKMTSGNGSGTDGGNPFICTGSISATGKASRPAVQ